MTDITKVHTKTLMRYKRESYGGNQSFRVYLDDATYTHEAIIEELNTREHVPNKVETKLARQERAKSSNRGDNKRMKRNKG